MRNHAGNTPEKKSQSVATAIAQKQSRGESTFQFVDNRTEAIVQRKLQEMADNCPRAIQLRAFQEMANHSPHTTQTAHLPAVADKYTLQPIQKKEDNTGLSDNLQSGIEEVSLIGVSDVAIQRMDNGRGNSDYESESEEDDGLIAVRDPYVREALEVLSGNNGGLALFVSNQMSVEINNVDVRLTNAIRQGLQNWGRPKGVQSGGYFGITNITDNEGPLAQKSEENWRIDPKKIPEVKHAISGAMWTGLRTHFDEEVGGQGGMGLLSPEVDVKGVKLRFTARTDGSDRTKVATKVRQFYTEILGANIRMLAEQVLRNQTFLKWQALRVWKETTGANPTYQEITDTMRAILKKKTSRKKLLEYLSAAKIGMQHALASGRIKLIIDRAKNKLAFGGASAANDTNAQQMMDMEIDQNIVNDHMIRVNLDATGLSGLKTTLAHEVAHVAGFNPTGMAASGHMQNVADYIAKEPGTGLPKLMVDAYFFEMIYTRFLNKG